MHILFWIIKSRANRHGLVPITMRITLNGKRVDMKTNISVDPNLWDNDKQRTKGNTPLLREYNNTLMNLTTAAWNHYNDGIRRGIEVSASSIRDLILNKNKPVYTLLESFSYYIDNLEKRVGYDIAPNTVKKFKTVETKLKLFLLEKLNRSDINLLEISHKFITDLDMFMKIEGGLKHNAVMKNMQQFKRVIRICIQNGWLEKDPFGNYKMGLKDTERGYLSPGELKIMEQTVLPNERLAHVRDIFIFCCYTGLAYADLSKLNRSHFEEGENGITWIKLNRTKSKSRAVIPLLPRAREILDKYAFYAKTNPEKKLLPVISNQNLNKYLKEGIPSSKYILEV